MFRILAMIFILFGNHTFAQKSKPTKQGILQGKLNPYRSNFDVTYMNMHIKVIPSLKRIEGFNEIHFRALADISRIQLDLNHQIQIDSVLYGGKRILYKRDSNVFYLNFEQRIPLGIADKVAIYFSGMPRVAVKPPWDGGFVWSRDRDGNHFVGVACEGIGPSIWFPCKDHWSDEPDSMEMKLTVPENLTGVSNGRLVGATLPINGYRTFTWRVSNPINLYGITVNVGKYVHFQDQYNPWIYPANMPLSLDYYVLGYNRDNAMKHFKQVQRMMACFERFFGLYPFWEDGFKLVEAPYWGMEHQSCVAYGNEYKNNNYGFDFIIIHESAHEWFANSITANDPAEMWIHESFTTYAEAIFVECSSGKEKAVEYLIGQRTLIGNKEPMIGPRDEYFHDRADNDIYYKGSWMLHTLRHAVSNDSLFFGALLGFSNTFKHKVIGTNDVIDYFSKALNRNLRPFFTQYLYTTKIPTLEYKISRTSDGKLIMRYRWANTVKGLGMSIQVTATKNKWEVVTPRKRWQLIDLNYFDENEFKINTDHSLIITKRLK